MTPSHRDRVRGCLVGGAVGDVLGGIGERGRACLSDDTQLTLATVEAIVRARGVDPAVVADVFLSWFLQRRLVGLGASTVKALRDLEAGAHWALAGATGEMAAGNGAAMRAAPLAFVLDPASPADAQLIRDVSRITHRNDEANAGAVAVIAAIRVAAAGRAPEPGEWLMHAAGVLPDCRVRDRLRAIGAVARDVSPARAAEMFGSSGFVADTVPLALLGAEAMVLHGFADQLALLVAACADADTIASIAGQVAGAALGIEGIDGGLRALVPDLDDVIRLADELAAVPPVHRT